MANMNRNKTFGNRVGAAPVRGGGPKILPDRELQSRRPLPGGNRGMGAVPDNMASMQRPVPAGGKGRGIGLDQRIANTQNKLQKLQSKAGMTNQQPPTAPPIGQPSSPVGQTLDKYVGNMPGTSSQPNDYLQQMKDYRQSRPTTQPMNTGDMTGTGSQMMGGQQPRIMEQPVDNQSMGGYNTVPPRGMNQPTNQTNVAGRQFGGPYGGNGMSQYGQFGQRMGMPFDSEANPYDALIPLSDYGYEAGPMGDYGLGQMSGYRGFGGLGDMGGYGGGYGDMGGYGGGYGDMGDYGDMGGYDSGYEDMGGYNDMGGYDSMSQMQQPTTPEIRQPQLGKKKINKMIRRAVNRAGAGRGMGGGRGIGAGRGMGAKRGAGAGRNAGLRSNKMIKAGTKRNAPGRALRRADGGAVMKGGGLARKGVGMALAKGGRVAGAGKAVRGRGKGRTC